MTLDEMIAAANKRFEEAEEGSTEAIEAQAQAEALKVAKEAGYTKTQDDLNSAERQTRKAFESYKKRVEGVVGDFEQFESLVKTQTPDPASQESGDEGEKDLFTRFQSALNDRDEAIKQERESRLNFERQYRQERLYGDLDKRLREADLQEGFREAVRWAIEPRMQGIVEKAMNEEDVSGELDSLVERQKELSPVFFQKPPEDGHIPNFNSGVPRSPQGGQPRQITDEERLRRAEIPT